MRPYEQYTVHELVLDSYFIKWVKNPDYSCELFWREWLQAHPGKRADIEEAVQMVKILASRPDAFSEKEIQLTWEAIQRQTAYSMVGTVAKAPRSFWRQWYAMAAMLTGIVIVGMGIWWQQTTVRFSTHYGETRTVSLPDGSLVTLNGNSELSYDRAWKSRQVTLKGEAFFKVKKQRQAEGLVKFRVKTGGLTIEVVGTVFTVTDYRGKTEVVLSEGKVQVNRNDTNAIQDVLVPGEKLTYYAKGEKITKDKVDPQLYSSWMNKTLPFEGQTLDEIFQFLDDRYGVHTNVENSTLLKKRFTGTIQTDSLVVFYNQIQKIYGVSVQPIADGFLIE